MRRAWRGKGTWRARETLSARGCTCSVVEGILRAWYADIDTLGAGIWIVCALLTRLTFSKKQVALPKAGRTQNAIVVLEEFAGSTSLGLCSNHENENYSDGEQMG